MIDGEIGGCELRYLFVRIVVVIEDSHRKVQKTHARRHRFDHRSGFLIHQQCDSRCHGGDPVEKGRQSLWTRTIHLLHVPYNSDALTAGELPKRGEIDIDSRVIMPDAGLLHHHGDAGLILSRNRLGTRPAVALLVLLA